MTLETEYWKQVSSLNFEAGSRDLMDLCLWWYCCDTTSRTGAVQWWCMDVGRLWLCMREQTC